jgi:hypothetical protein
MRIMNKKNKSEVIAIPLKGLRRNWDFEVITKCIIDDEGIGYPTEEYIPKNVDRVTIEISEDDIPDYTDLAFRYEVNDEVSINLINAKKCGFGVSRIMKGKFKNKQYMFPIIDFSPALQLFAYGLITHDYCDPYVSIKLLKDADKREL